jgi:hypothetical protein
MMAVGVMMNEMWDGSIKYLDSGQWQQNPDNWLLSARIQRHDNDLPRVS